MSHLHLDLPLRGDRSPGEDGQDHLGPVQHRHLPGLLEVALLPGAQAVVDDHRRAAQLGQPGGQRLNGSAPEEGRRVRFAHRYGAALNHQGAQGAGELLQLVELDLGPVTPAGPTEGADDDHVVQLLADTGIGAGTGEGGGHRPQAYDTTGGGSGWCAGHEVRPHRCEA